MSKIQITFRVEPELKQAIQEANAEGKREDENGNAIIEAFGRALAARRITFKDGEIQTGSPDPVIVEKEVIKEIPVEKIVEKEVIKEVIKDSYDLKPLIDYAARRRVTVQSFINSLSKM